MSNDFWSGSDNSMSGVEADESQRSAPLTISQLNQLIKSTLEEQIPRLWVAGEISDLSRPSSGHIYFSLKDEQSQIRAVMWRSAAQRLKFKLEDGMAIHAYGNTEVYIPRGSYQLICLKIEPQGVGSLQLAFQQLHAKLSKEGLFAAERKKRLPAFPKRVGFVTSPSGAALKDFLEVIRRRWSHISVVVIPARVQGAGSVEDIVRGIQIAHEIEPPLDILVVGRGGGSMEDLWSFNDERVVRALAASRIPTVSAVGHEIDVTLSDLAADIRALTPTEAAERIVPNQVEMVHLLHTLHSRMTTTLRRQAQWYRRRIKDLSLRPVLARPQEVIRMRSQTLDQLETRALRAIRHRLAMLDAKLKRQAASLEALSPLSVLTRGYSITQKAANGKLITSSDQVKPGDRLKITLKHGALETEVKDSAGEN
jgi:exodeoxyribonuclease VII large subunit